jgi:endonuclease/exonuclease/phosphatase family metal-dependent hydrolase
VARRLSNVLAVYPVLLVALAVVSAVRFGPEWVSLPAGSGGDIRAGVVRALSWNLELGARDGPAVAAVLASTDVDVVALQELGPDHAAAIVASSQVRTRFPYQILEPREGVFGMGLLARYPITSSVSTEEPLVIEAVVETPDGPVTVIDSHPLPGRIATATPLRLPVGFDPSHRDALLAAVRARAHAAIERGERVLLIGDFNVAPTEPAYLDLAAGLRDVHAQVGLGPGWTWRPARFEVFNVGLLRIDMAFVGPGIEPVGTSVDCGLPGDHCRLFVDMAIGGDAARAVSGPGAAAILARGHAGVAGRGGG